MIQLLPREDSRAARASRRCRSSGNLTVVVCDIEASISSTRCYILPRGCARINAQLPACLHKCASQQRPLHIWRRPINHRLKMTLRDLAGLRRRRSRNMAMVDFNGSDCSIGVDDGRAGSIVIRDDQRSSKISSIVTTDDKDRDSPAQRAARSVT